MLAPNHRLTGGRMSSVPTRDELLAMPASDYMNQQQQAFFNIFHSNS